MFLYKACKSCSTFSLHSKTRLGQQIARKRKHCSAAMQGVAVNFLDVLPVLNGENHKGQHGRVAVIGGCSDFTGAPFFAAYAAMRAGADYGNVVCTKSAAAAIKSYAPELIVHPCMIEVSDFFTTWEEVEVSEGEKQKAVAQSMKHVERWLEKVTCVIIGPGLGQDPIMSATAARIIAFARQKGLPLVLDADAITIVARDPHLVKGYNRAILTPNVPELWRLADAVGVLHDKESPWESPDLAYGVAMALEGPILVAKGMKDIVWTFVGSELVCFSPPGLVGCPKRCGGQGDVLSGILGTAMSWAVAYSKRQGLDARDETNVLTEATVQSLQVIRLAAYSAFARTGRSVVASDIIECLPSVIQQHWTSQQR